MLTASWTLSLGTLTVVVCSALRLRACICDIWRREIPNDVPVLLTLTAVVFSIADTGSVAGLSHLAWWPAAALLAAGFALSLANIWGAGDAKLLAALALFCPNYWPDLIGLTALAGGFLAAGYLFKNRYSRNKSPTLPYGVAISCAFGILTMSTV